MRQLRRFAGDAGDPKKPPAALLDHVDRAANVEG
jgi:hypothetical protein